MTTAWLIRFTDKHRRPRVAISLHNSIADYRVLDPAATVQAFDLLGVANLVEAVEAGMRFGMQFSDPAAGDAIHAALLQTKGGKP